MSRRARVPEPVVEPRSKGLSVAELLAVQERHHGPGRLARSLGDGYLYAKNPTFRRVRDASLRAGFRYGLDEPRVYYAFPLISLGALLESRCIPYRDTLAGLEHLERARPRFFTLSDLRANRPQPNYLLHESAHALGFHELFGRPESVSAELARPDRLVHVMLCEAFAMTAEYLAACAVSDPLHAWLFSISSYRRRTQGKKAIGELVLELGLAPVASALLGAFLYTNFLVERLSAARVERIWVELALGARLPGVATRNKLARALNALMRMNPEFLLDTARLFLTMHGYPRDVRRLLARDPLDLLAASPGLPFRVARLTRHLVSA